MCLQIKHLLKSLPKSNNLKLLLLLMIACFSSQFFSFRIFYYILSQKLPILFLVEIFYLFFKCFLIYWGYQDMCVNWKVSHWSSPSNSELLERKWVLRNQVPACLVQFSILFVTKLRIYCSSFLKFHFLTNFEILGILSLETVTF